MVKTNLVIQAAPLPANIRATPQEFFEAIVARMKIVSTTGFNNFVIGSTRPLTNEGPWLKDGKAWYVWDDDLADYVPVDITDSFPQQYFLQDTEPTEFSPPIWFKTSGGIVVGVYFSTGTAWVPITMTSGTTAQRPASPYAFQRYYDTTIQCEIWYERGAWRTVDGSRGDVKYVRWATSKEALDRNPGWEILGTGETDDVDWRGRALAQATKDPTGADGFLDLSLGTNISDRESGDTFGEESHVQTQAELAQHSHQIKGRALAPAGTDLTPSRVIIDDDYLSGEVTENTQTRGSSDAMNVLGTRLALWCLCKT